tara:strand:+ start:411 stop:2627 length:2217 start_codon:yes stop_codon:yes gene_type:complete
MNLFSKTAGSANNTFLFSLVLLVLPASSLLAQTASLNQKNFSIPRVDQAPQIDGRLSPGEWDNAVVITDLHESQPVEFSDPEYPTVFRMMYTDDALYFSAYVYDDPEQLTATVMRNETSLRFEDQVGLIIDPFNNKRSGYLFQTNPNGVRHEAIYTSATSFSFDWATIWNANAELVEDGWTAEMEIPFKSLTFNPENETWGVNFTRQNMTSQSNMAWYSYNGQTNPANSGEMTGFRNLNQGVGLDLIPSFSTDYRENYVTDSSSSDFNPSFDLTYKLTSSMNLTMTWNTDFAATEVDDIQLDLDRFSTRLPEKRSFFLTDMDIFQFGNSGGFFFGGNNTPQAFNSRNIGLSDDGTPVDLTGGAKLSGRIAGFDVGTLVIRQEEFNNVDPTNIYIGRVKRTVLSQSELGAIITNGDPTSNDSSSTLGVDFTYRNTRLSNNRNVVSTFWVQQTDNPGIETEDMAWHADIDFPSNDSWYASATIEEVQENFDPRLGFANRTGVRQYDGEIGNNWIFRDHPFLREITTEFSATQYDYLDSGDLQSRTLEWNPANFENLRGDQLNIEISNERQVLLPGERAPLARLGVIIPPGEYDFTRYQAFYSTSQSRPFSYGFRVQLGDYYSGRARELQNRIDWRPSSRLSFNLSYNYNTYDMPGQTVDTRVIEFENVLTFSPSLSIVNLIQYENVSDSIGFNSRLRWNLQSGQDIWFVLGHGMRDEDEDGHFTDTESTATFKIRYTLRY